MLLHGVGLDGTVWDEVRSILPSRWQVSAPDLLGHGRRRPAPAGVRLADLAADIAEQLEPHTHIVGFSLGALVAQHLAVHHWDRIATLTNISSVCQRTTTERAAVMTRLQNAERDFHASSAASVRRWFPQTPTDAPSVRSVATMLSANDPVSFVNCYRVFATADAEIADHLSSINVASLAVTGELDTGSTPAMSKLLAAAIPNCGLEIVTGARHMLPVQSPQVVADLLTTFIGDTPPWLISATKTTSLANMYPRYPVSTLTASTLRPAR